MYIRKLFGIWYFMDRSTLSITKGKDFKRTFAQAYYKHIAFKGTHPSVHTRSAMVTNVA